MKSLRKTIRTILLESQGNYQKLITLLNGEPESIRQGLELAMGIGMIDILSWDRDYGDHPAIGNRRVKYEKVIMQCLDDVLAETIRSNKVPRKRYTYWTDIGDGEFHLTFRYTEAM